MIGKVLSRWRSRLQGAGRAATQASLTGASTHGPRAVTAEPLNVMPPLVGLPLGTPRQRALAMAVDLAVLALLASTSGYWLALALLGVAWRLRGTLALEGARPAARVALAVAVVAAAAAVAWSEWRGAPAAHDAAPARAGVESGEAAGDGERVARLQAELERLRGAQHRPRGMSERMDELLGDVRASFGWGLVYFTLLPAWWRGQTLGKRLFGLRVVELTGKPITPLLALKRYGAYTAGMATMGLGFLQLLWEPNRQALHDKAAHTVVVLSRAADAAEAAAAAAAAAGTSAAPPANPPAA